MSTPAFANALAINCHPHHAASGASCWSSVTAVCPARIAAAAQGKGYVPASPEPSTPLGPKLERDAVEVRIAEAMSKQRREAPVRAAVRTRSRR